jgi:hypothetical protein
MPLRVSRWEIARILARARHAACRERVVQSSKPGCSSIDIASGQRGDRGIDFGVQAEPPRDAHKPGDLRPQLAALINDPTRHRFLGALTQPTALIILQL